MSDGAPRIITVSGLPILHPVALGAIGLLILNDHVLKDVWAGTLTGKLSDVAGLVFFPLFVASLWLLAADGRIGRARQPPITVVAISAAAVAIGFALVKTVVPAAVAYEHALGLLQWPFASALAMLRGGSPVAVRPVDLVMDPTDLLALPAVALAVWLAWDRDRNRRPSVRPVARPLALAVLVLAALGSVATTPARYSSQLEDETTFTVEVSRDEPTALIVGTVTTDPGAAPEDVFVDANAQIYIEWSRLAGGQLDREGLRMTMVPLDGALDAIMIEDVYVDPLRPGQRGPCTSLQDPCERRFLLAITADSSDEAGEEVDVTAGATLNFDFTGSEAEPEPGTSVKVPDGASLDISLGRLGGEVDLALGPSARLTSQIRFGPREKTAAVGYTMTLPPEVASALADGGVAVARLSWEGEDGARINAVLDLEGDVHDRFGYDVSTLTGVVLSPFDGCVADEPCRRALRALWDRIVPTHEDVPPLDITLTVEVLTFVAPGTAEDAAITLEGDEDR
jgi:hypothetical protein